MGYSIFTRYINNQLNMKNRLSLLLLLISGFAYGQTRSLSASGRVISLAPAITLSNTTTETDLISTVIPANSLSNYKRIKFKIYCSLTSALVTPNLTVRIKFGSNSVTVINGLGVNISQTSKPFTIEGIIVNRGNTMSQYVYGEIKQNASIGPLALTSPTYNANGIIATNTETDQTFSVTGQFSSTSATSSLTIDFWEIIAD